MLTGLVTTTARYLYSASILFFKYFCLFSKAIGKFIDSSGLSKLMVDAELLAEGSVRGFISGTHFNRCKKLHVVAALALKTLHFKTFLELNDNEANPDHIRSSEIIEILERDAIEHQTSDFIVPILKEFLERYDLFIEQTLAGKRGCTAQFALIYVSLIELYLLLERAIRTSDVELYKYATYEISAQFFAFNHHNYARWLVRNNNDLMNIENTHPGLLEELKSGAMSIRRTPKTFCRSPIDLTVEQTINANAANRLTGITCFTNNLQARQRWSETHSARTAITSSFLESLGLVRFAEVETQYRSKIFAAQVKKFTRTVCENINPFDDSINPRELFNLSSGRAASPEIAEFLLNITSIGAKLRDEFIEECLVDSSRFHRPIKRNTIKNFATENVKQKKSLATKSDASSVERNVLGHVLYFAIENKIDLLNVFSYPLTMVPHSIANLDGTMNSNSQKGELTSLLLSRFDDREHPPEKFAIEIIDGFYYLGSLRESPNRYGHFAEFLLKQLCRTTAYEVHLIFDNDETPSIRDVNVKKKVHENPTQYEIKGPNQERNAPLSKCLTNPKFKEELVKFLINHWTDNEDARSILGDKRVFVSYGHQCYVYSKDCSTKKIAKNFDNNHIELESKIVLHLEKVVAKNILMKISCTDSIIVYVLYQMQFWKNDRAIWIETGDVRKNTMKLISVQQISRHLSHTLINALPAWYVFTGCRYEPSFHGKARKSCLKVLEKSPQFQISFGNIGTTLPASQHDVAVLEAFTCELYHANVKTVNEARLNIFENSYKINLAKGKLHDLSKNGMGRFMVHVEKFREWKNSRPKLSFQMNDYIHSYTACV